MNKTPRNSANMRSADSADRHDRFKRNCEELAARDFLKGYNSLQGSHFQLVDESSEPDFHAQDLNTNAILHFEVTQGTSRKWIDTWRELHEGTYDNNRLGKSISIQEECDTCTERILKKFSKRYGPNCALAVYYFSPLWAKEFLKVLRASIDFSQSPFDRGIWLVCSAEFYRIDQPDSAR
jgi:hypothetical protein